MEVEQLLAYFENEFWVAQVFIVVFISLLVDWIQKRVLRKLHNKLERTKNLWDDALIDVMRQPLSALI